MDNEKLVAVGTYTNKIDADLAQGALEAADIDAMISGDDAGGWTGQLIVAGGSDSCTGTVTDVTMTSPAAKSIRIEARAVMTKTFQPDKDGFCNTDDAKKAAEGQPCSSLEVTTATFNSDL